MRVAAASGGAGLLPAGLLPTSVQAAAGSPSQVALPPATPDIARFKIHVPQQMLEDLKKRLSDTRWPLPVILTHGWPGSVVEFLQVISPLVDPTSHGGKAEDAFHVVIPSLPGFGFSDKPTESGWRLPRIANAWAELMKRLGYSRYVAQGGDWGAGVTSWMAKQ